MSHRHAASKATQAAVGAAKSATAASAPSNATAVAGEHSDVKFARAFVKAALHGHSPLWKYQGWRSSGSEKSKNPKVNPHKYLARRLIEGVLPDTPPRKFLRQQEKLKPLKKYTRHFSTSAIRKAYNVQDEPEEEDYAEEDPSEDAEGLPSLSLLAAKRQLHPGDWVQMRQFNQSSGAIYLAEDKINASRGGRRFLVHGFGNVLHSVRQEDILFTIPGVVSVKTAKLATRILGLSPQEFIEHLEEEDEPSAGGASPVSEIILDDKTLWNHYGIEHGSEGWKTTFAAKSECVAVLRDMKLKQEKARAAVAARGPRSLYDHFVQSGDIHITTLDAYTTLFKQKKEISIEDPNSTGERHRHYLLALHDTLMDDPEHFVLHSFGTLLNSEFRVRPREELERLRQVREWVRKDSNEVRQFCRKSRDVRDSVARSREEAIASLAKGNHSSPIASQENLAWTKEDLRIIRFLENSLEMRRKLQANPFESAASLLLRRALALNEHENVGSDGVSPTIQARQATIDFLKSIGVYNDWENLTLRDREANLSQRQKLLSAYKPSTSEVNENVDGLDSMRHDFGQLPVYVIDDIGASELDDGISIEPCKNDGQDPQTYWVHVHIADPTSTLTPNSTLAQQARSFATAVYLPEFVSPMFPDSAMKQHAWSLGSEAPNKGQRVLTFSARIDEGGNVLEKQVRAAMVNNVATTTYDKVNEILGASSPSPSQASDRLIFTWPTASMPPAQENLRSLSDLPSGAKGDFSTLQRLSHASLKQRVASGHITWQRSSNESNLILGPRPFFSSLDTELSTSALSTFQQPPHLAFTLPSTTRSEESSVTSDRESANIVAEFMILAGRIAASHLSSRQIPALYRAQDAPNASSPQALQEFLASRDLETGMTTFEAQLEKEIAFLPAYFSPTPSNHWTMGIKGSSGGYVQATSPLRRYNDMMIHWQLKSTLKKGKPAFSYNEIEQHIKQYTPFDKLLKKLDQRSRNFWKLFIMQKKLAQIRNDPLSDMQASELLFSNLTGKVIAHKLDYASLRIIARLVIPELGGILATLVLDPKSYGDIKIGQKFNVEIADIVLDDYSKMFVKLRN